MQNIQKFLHFDCSVLLLKIQINNTITFLRIKKKIFIKNDWFYRKKYLHIFWASIDYIWVIAYPIILAIHFPKIIKIKRSFNHNLILLWNYKCYNIGNRNSLHLGKKIQRNQKNRIEFESTISKSNKERVDNWRKINNNQKFEWKELIEKFWKINRIKCIFLE